jgi:ubiquinone/menaquinone biosynthesis C-methylase UbiE
MAWVLLLAAAAAVLLIGALATLLVLGRAGAWPTPPWGFWWRLGAACALTVLSVSLRSLRWIFLLRRAETRIPIRDAYIGYFAGLSLLFAPLLLGEIAIRALVNKRRGGVPMETTAVVDVWERVLDLVSLGIIAVCAAALGGRAELWMAVGLGVVLLSLVAPCRRLLLSLIVSVVAPVARLADTAAPRDLTRLASHHAWLTGLAASLVAWVLPGWGFWLLAGAWDAPFSVVAAQFSYAESASVGGLMLAPGGVLVAGRQMIDALNTHGMSSAVAALTVLATRLSTVGVSMALGVVFLLVHVRTAAASSETHFDDIADAYDVQIPESRRHALLDRKTRLMQDIIQTRGIGGRGLDVGCGQGAYVVRMRLLGFDVSGIDASAGQVQMAARNVGHPGIVQVGSVLEIPADDGTFDFLYIINVLHHLGSVEEQRRAFAELFRVLKPGGLLFVHEINTRNLLFRFYMGYVFPSLNCIDEGIERWLLPHRMTPYTDTPVADVRYFTFLPDFIPQGIARSLRPIEHWMERSSLRAYSAHYMAVLVNGPSGRS